ncbi:hypothetical protein [Clostridioides difficile]|uniref:hypothetical protein n=1 Tax=Clostridioides difficile TaxID=1496 RepID=UPI000D1EEC4B|nr:hypothetical protein [Clostridioides difficile]EKS7089354.1 hypothetical protein [Clostridioides difficile]MBF9867528.1 hypothetical protein [Clostridioides difficile]MBY1216458.1 hypothetical protein [Clostridioides difficile]MBZ1029659.1 hypothetical protein [Clostridioides difficile]MCA0852527.1 hypothetical protein [Clostridioides difficile]
MRFEIGKTYKFDKEKFMEINGVEQYKEYKELWIDDIEGVEFTVEKTFDDGYVCYPNEFRNGVLKLNKVGGIRDDNN